MRWSTVGQRPYPSGRFVQERLPAALAVRALHSTALPLCSPIIFTRNDRNLSPQGPVATCRAGGNDAAHAPEARACPPSDSLPPAPWDTDSRRTPLAS